MKPTLTPRTDGIQQTIAVGDFVNQNEGLSLALDHARQLERELNEANERIKRLEEAGDEMEQRHCRYGFGKWKKAKEDKP